MNFISLHFLTLIVLTISLTKIAKTARQQNIIVIIANVVFYSFWSLQYLCLLIIESTMLFFISKKICYSPNTKFRKILLSLGVTLPLLLLGIFKYYNFFISSFKRFGLSTNSINIIVPIGISFHSFMMISFIVDSYFGKVEKIDIFEMLSYSIFFPTILSGPVCKSRNIIPQFKKHRILNNDCFKDSLSRFTIGVFKKVVIADRLSVYVDAVFSTPKAYSWITLIIASVAYSLQLYFDFSGYSDMAIAVANSIGIRIDENFLFPYISKNPTEFWKRWHISLSSWLQEYLYIPLGGNRKGKYRTYLNLIITMVLGGMWHGANWTYVLWGFIHGIALVLHKMFVKITSSVCRLRNNKFTEIEEIIFIIINYVFVSLCWIIFRSDSIDTAFTIFKRIFTLAKGIDYFYVYTFVYLFGLMIIQFIIMKRRDINNNFIALDLNNFLNKIILCGMILIILSVGYYGDTAFIYGHF